MSTPNSLVEAAKLLVVLAPTERTPGAFHAIRTHIAEQLEQNAIAAQARVKELEARLGAIDKAMSVAGMRAHWQDCEGLAMFYRHTIALFSGAQIFGDVEKAVAALRAANAELEQSLRKIRDDGMDAAQCMAVARSVLARHAAVEHCEDCDPSFSCWANGSQCRKHADTEWADVEVGLTTSGRINVSIPGKGSAVIDLEHAQRLHDLLGARIAGARKEEGGSNA